MVIAIFAILFDTFAPENDGVVRDNVNFFNDPEAIPQIGSLVSPIFCIGFLIILAMTTFKKQHCQRATLMTSYGSAETKTAECGSVQLQ